jgi:bacterioferritin-associated ferredoxin
LEPKLIICSCAVITDRDIDVAVAEIMSTGPGILPTPGVVFRHLNKKMNCCRCAPIAVSAIYSAMDRLAETTNVCPFALADARAKLVRIEERRERRQRRIDAEIEARRAARRRAVA